MEEEPNVAILFYMTKNVHKHNVDAGKGKAIIANNIY